MKEQDFTFKKEERMCGQKVIDRLFSEGKSFLVHPLRVVYLLEPCEDVQETGTSVLISVSKKRFRRAVKRNRIKRLVRESFRLNKHEIYELPSFGNYRLQIAFLYIHQEILGFEEVEKAVKKAFEILKGKLV